MYAIMGTYRGNTEQIDSAETKADALYLVGEYQLAFGNEWRVFKRRERSDNE